MPGRLLRQRGTGRVYTWDPYIAARDDMQEVTEEQAYPERFMPTEVERFRGRLVLDFGNLDEAEPSLEEYPGLFTGMESAHFENAARMNGGQPPLINNTGNAGNATAGAVGVGAGLSGAGLSAASAAVAG